MRNSTLPRGDDLFKIVSSEIIRVRAGTSLSNFWLGPLYQTDLCLVLFRRELLIPFGVRAENLIEWSCLSWCFALSDPSVIPSPSFS
jgi:hypothetical protein